MCHPLQNAHPHEDPWKPRLTHYPLGATTHLWKHRGFLWHSVDTEYLFLMQRPSHGTVSIFHISVFVLIKGFPLRTESDCSLLPGLRSQWGDRGGGPLDLSIIGSGRCWRGGAKAQQGEHEHKHCRRWVHCTYQEVDHTRSDGGGGQPESPPEEHGCHQGRVGTS